MVNLISEITEKMIIYFDGDVKRINHALKVHGFAKTIGEIEGISGEKLKILEAAAILHDIGIKESEKKYSSSAGKYQEMEGPPIARDILREFNLRKDFVDRVCYLIGNHHTYDRINGIDFQALIEADFIVNIFEDGIDGEHASKICQKYFRTDTGISFIKSMYRIK